MLHKLVLFNFKSYKGAVEVNLGASQFSAIVGPNGAGKSNLMDAISFVLGSSLVDLRTRNFKDLIWRDPKESQESSQETVAYVEAHFDDFVLRRTLGDSAEHFIDAQRVDYDEYMARIELHNISRHNNSLVFQGNIEKMANLTPHQLSDLFEKISGSNEYRDEYSTLATSVAEKRQVSADVGRNRTKQLNLVKRIDASRETHKERKRLDQRMKKLGNREAALRVALLDCRQAEAEQGVKRLKREHKLAAKSNQDSHGEIKAVKRQLVQAIREIQLHEDESRALKLSSKRATAGLLNNQSQLELCAQRLDDLGPQLSTCTKELELSSTQVSSVAASKESTQRGFTRLLSEIPEYKGDIGIYHKCNQEFELETSLEQAEIDRYRRRTVALESDLRVLEEQRHALELRKSQVEHQICAVELNVHESDSKLARYNEHEQSLEADRALVKARLDSLQQEIRTQEPQLKERAQRLREMQSDKRRAEKQNSLLERVQKLKRRFEGVLGVLYTLLQPKEPEFAAAIDLILGSNFNAVLVDSVPTAQLCIEYCQDNNLGVMTFLPLDSLDIRPIDSKLRVIDGARLAVDALSYDREYASAVAHACGDSLICDSTDLAYSIHQRFPFAKLVSIDGTVIHSNNIVTAGGGAETNRFDKSRAATLRAQVSDLVETLKAYKLNESSSAQQLFEINERLGELRAKHQQLCEDNKAAKTTLKAFASDLKQCSAQKLEIDGRDTEIRRELSQCEDDMRTIEYGFANLKKRIFAPFTATTNVNIETFQSALVRRSKLQADYDRQLARLEEEHDYVESKRKGCQARVDLLQQQYDELNQLHSEAAPKIEQHRQTLAEAKEKAMELQDKISNCEIQVETLNADLVELQGRELDQDDESDEIKQQIKDLKEGAQRAEEQRSLIEDCNDELVIELVQDLETSENIQLELDKVQTEIRNFASERENLIISHDLDDVDLESAEETLIALNEQLVAAQHQVTVAERALDKARKKRMAAFESVLSRVQEYIPEIYKELTTTRIDPLGGTAALQPVNESEPFLDGLKFSAMPPRKPFTSIHSLSGGEKTIAALALIFALNKVQASPIYVLDEVDAALDYANVHLVAKYIAKCARNGSQFLVISLKLWFFEHAGSLLGVYRRRDAPGSNLIAYDLGAGVDTYPLTT